MIQDIAPKKYDNAFHVKSPRDSDTVFVFDKNTVLCHKSGEKVFYPTLVGLGARLGDCTFLFSIDDSDYFLLRTSGYSMPDGFGFQNITLFRTALPSDLAFAGFVAWQLYNWYNDNKFCGRCGQALVPSDKERMLACASCGNSIYPKISPGVIVAITAGDRLLMTKYADRPYSNYALVAGFTEIGETLEQTVEREVMEEVGLKVKNITYYKNQPWAFSSSLLCGFFAEVDGDTTVTLQTDELASAEWFSREEIALQPDNLSLTREMMMVFKNGR
ncbi:MAG: pyrophosphohydrolase containing a Zn-finger [Oscillospiraceae bacterium]|nr:pyrophosphohydrolase containing a Zn-finger [Oscillospiraceae bacterium]